ncbi:protein kinase C theta type-like [Xenopus laevis]|uniref:Protein kinase C theta type-like n=1 Tax=Xenopus laevis TaxID=8355 RepID=A0A8J1KNM4_XENLA|nr:protein kinase C theta type-like [Xenopus laevis]
MDDVGGRWMMSAADQCCKGGADDIRGGTEDVILSDEEYDYSVDYYSLGVTLFQISTGLKVDQLYTPEAKAEINKLSPELRDFILKLLCGNPEKRMEFVSSMKSHPFLEPINWEALESGKLKPPFTMVLLARELDTKQLIAVKVAAKSKVLEFVSSVMIEMEILKAAQDCEFLTPEYVTFQSKDDIYFVMEYLSGAPCIHFISRKNPLIWKPFVSGRESFWQPKSFADWISFMRGDISIDLKPDNILLDGRGHAKIADFGLATRIVNGKAKGCAGTLGYVAPEILSDEEYDYSVDYYSLGVTLFQISTGLKVDQLYTPEAKAEINKLSPELRDFILKLLCGNLEKRMEFVSAIKSHPFLEPINWEALESGKLKPPFTMPQPKILGKGVPYTTLMSFNAKTVPISESQQGLFKGIPFVKL